MKKTNYFKVTAKCGHVGKRKYVPITFAVVASNKKEAAKRTRKFPRVKRNHKDAILNVKQICYDDYLTIRNINDNDPYLKCRNIQEQRKIENFDSRLEAEQRYLNNDVTKTRKERVQYKLKIFKELNKLHEREINEYLYQFN